MRQHPWQVEGAAADPHESRRAEPHPDKARWISSGHRSNTRSIVAPARCSGSSSRATVVVDDDRAATPLASPRTPPRRPGARSAGRRRSPPGSTAPAARRRRRRQSPDRDDGRPWFSPAGEVPSSSARRSCVPVPRRSGRGRRASLAAALPLDHPDREVAVLREDPAVGAGVPAPVEVDAVGATVARVLAARPPGRDPPARSAPRRAVP